LGYIGVEKDFPRQTSSISKREKRSMRLLYCMIVILMANGFSID